MSETGEIKAALRRRLREDLRGMTAEARATESARLCARLVAAPFWAGARAILAFVPLPSEPDIWEVVRSAATAGRTVCLPRFDAGAGVYRACVVRDLERDLEVGPYGIPEPRVESPIMDGKQLDLLLVPGIGFSPSGGRLGRGKGFYDRLLAALPGSGKRCGIAFDQQVISEFPLEPHDVRLDYLVTPSRCFPIAPNPPASA